MSTKHRVILAATIAFADRGVAGTSLDALAAELGVTKQTILYHFGSKDGLLTQVLTEAAAELLAELDAAIARSRPGWDRVEATIRASFALAIRRPELLGLLREVNRLGQPWSALVLEVLSPLVEQAVAYLESGMESGQFRSNDPRLVLVSSYAAVTGVVTDAEVLRAVGLELDLRVAVGLRRTLLSFLRAALIEDP